jgi:hypothetical protein
MSEKAILRMSRLREIGWSAWDPIGLGGAPADEYDSYLLRLVGLVRQGATDTKCVDCLVKAEIEQIVGVDGSPDTHDRAVKTVALVREYLATIPEGQLSIRD